MKDKPSKTWWDDAKKYLDGCSAEELRLLRIMAARKLEKILAQWDNKVDSSLEKSETAKAKAIKRKIIKKAEV
jgi:hypothetical protein